MADIVIQPWDKEYWSKGARKRLVDEYRTAGREGRVKEVEATEGIRRTSDQITDTRRHGYDIEKLKVADTLSQTSSEIADNRRNRLELERLAQQYINRMAEAGTNFQYDQDLLGKRQAFESTEAALRDKSALERTTAIQERQDRELAGVFKNEALEALRKTYPNMSTGELDLKAGELANRNLNVYKLKEIEREHNFNKKVAANPELILGAGIGAQTRAEDSAAERARKAAFMQQYNLGQQFPSGGIPAAPQGAPARIPWPPKVRTPEEKLLEKY